MRVLLQKKKLEWPLLDAIFYLCIRVSAPVINAKNKYYAHRWRYHLAQDRHTSCCDPLRSRRKASHPMQMINIYLTLGSFYNLLFWWTQRSPEENYTALGCYFLPTQSFSLRRKKNAVFLKGAVSCV